MDEKLIVKILTAIIVCMKNTAPHKGIIVTLMIMLFMATVIIRNVNIYRLEAKNFKQEMEKAVRTGLKEYLLSQDIKTSYLLSQTPSYIKIKYMVGENLYVVNPQKQQYGTAYLRMRYDFFRDRWSTDSLAAQIRKLTSYAELPATIVRKDAAGQIIDSYPADCSIPSEPATFTIDGIGTAYSDSISVWCEMPFSLFKKRQGFLYYLTIILLRWSLLFCFLIIYKNRTDYRNRLLLEKQAIFIHDLKSPLCTNRNIANHLLKNTASHPLEKFRQKAETLLHLSREMQNEINRFLFDYDTMPEAEDYREFNLKEMLQRAITHHSAGNDISILLDFKRTDTNFEGSEFHIEHMVNNLLSNAIKHAGQGKTIQVACYTTPQGQTAISIIDQGDGNVSATEDSTESHGMGLPYISRNIRRYGGSFTIRNRQEGGKECVLTLSPQKRAGIFHIPSYLYIAFIGLVVLLGALGVLRLYNSYEQYLFNTVKERIHNAVANSTQQSIHWRKDTTFFRYDHPQGTVTVFRNLKSRTLPTTTVSTRDFVRMAYDLRDTTWSLYSVYKHYLELSPTPIPIELVRTDSTGKVLERLQWSSTLLFHPYTFNIPLGYVDGDRLQVNLYTPWSRFFTHYAWQLFFAFASILLLCWMAYILYQYDMRTKAFVLFQQKKTVRFIKNLKQELTQTEKLEQELHAPELPDIEIKKRMLQQLLEHYSNMLNKVNLLLDQMATFRRKQ